MDEIQQAIDAICAGKAVLLPTDTVYGLCSTADRDEPVARLYQLKGRGGTQPIALVASTVDMLSECVPELRGRASVIASTLFPGPLTLVLPNPARRYRWLTGARSDTIGVRVPQLPESARRVLDGVGCIAATSANDAGGADPAVLDDVPERIRSACAAELDAGRLPGTPSTVIDFTGRDPVVIRHGAASAADAIGRVEEALSV